MTELHELTDAELRHARLRWKWWSGAYGKYPTEAEFEAEFAARRAARAYDRELEAGLPSTWLHPDWPHERARDGSRLPFG